MDERRLRSEQSQLRLLLVIASFGDKNLKFLKSIIRTYLRMDMSVDVMVVSNEPKDLGPDVKVVVGLPSRNPWSLPFAHKPIFARNVDGYDLFIYSEDDIAVTEDNLMAFLQLTAYLKPDEIAGFLRYEVNQDGERSLPDARGFFHWKPESAASRGDYTVAEFTNEHAGFYILTQLQLKQAIASGGFLRGPCQGRYGWPETAATDPYTNCGFRKVVCISRLDDFLIHHLTNRYAGRVGIRLPVISEHIEALRSISLGRHPASTLCRVESKSQHGEWSKCYYDLPENEILESVPADAKTVLSVGVGNGALESSLMERGKLITALPLDSVAGFAASRLGMEVLYGSLEDCFDQLKTRRFDCVLMTNLLHLQPDVEQIVRRCCEHVGESGVLVLSGPHFQNSRIWVKRALNIHGYRMLRSFHESGVDVAAKSKAIRQIRRSGLKVVSTQWFNREASSKQPGFRRWSNRFMAENWVLQARRA